MPDEDVVRFGDGFELDRTAYELRRSGRSLKVERIPMETLLLLVERRGQLVSREDIIARIWGKDVFLDTDTSINSAIRKIRQVLKDDPENPVFIQTVTGKGYRFIAPVTLATPPPSATTPSPGNNNVILSGAREPAAGEANGAESKDPDASRTATFSGALPPPSSARGAASRFIWIPLAAVVLIAAGFVAWRLRPHPPLPPMSAPIPLTTYRGSQAAPSFSPDGTQVAFHWDGEKEDNFDIYVKSLGVDATPLRLTTNPAPDRWPAWSPDGTTIAFERNIVPGRTDLMLIPALGGPERKLAEFSTRLGAIGLRPTWSNDNKWLIVPGKAGDATALFRVSVETGETTPITDPGTGLEDVFPTISPDGKALLFARVPQLYNLGELYRIPLDTNAKPAGPPKRIAGGETTDGLGVAVWTPDGNEILARTYIGADRLPADGSAAPTQISWPGQNPTFLEFSRRGNRLAYATQSGDANIYRIDLTGKNPTPESVIASTERDVFPQYSPDGSRLAFYSYRTGVGQVYVSDAEGKLTRQLTFVTNGQAATPHWSPDSKTLTIDSNETGVSQIYLVNPDGGKMTQITHGPYVSFCAIWSRDGKWMYFASKQTGRSEIWKMPNGGGPAIQITHNGGLGAMESLDGKTLYFSKEAGAGSIWKMPVGGGPEEQIADSLFRTNFAVTQRGIYYMTSPGFSRKSAIRFYNFANQATTTILPIGIPEFGLDVSPDGRYLVYDQVDNPGSVLMLIENFH